VIPDHGLRRGKGTRRLWTLAGILALLAVTAAGTWLVKPTGSAAATTAPPEVAALEDMQRGLVWVAQTVEPSVVFIEAARKVEGRTAEGDGEPGEGLPDPWWESPGPDTPFSLPGPRLGPRARPQPQVPSVGQGSGVIIDAAGYILTNNHVVADASKIVVHLQDGDSYPAEVVGADKLSDLAVIKIGPKRALTPAKLGDADEVKPGMWAIAVGYPFGGHGESGYGSVGGLFDQPQRYEPTLTLGVISAVDRQIQSDIPGRPFRELIQTDAPINPGNSGGPLVNVRAEVIGINQAIFTSAPLGGNIGVGFAIPINPRTREIINSLKGGEIVVRGQLGVMVKALTPAVKGVYGGKNGVFVDSVQPDSPAAEGGLKAEDVITTYNGKEVTSSDQFVSMVQGTKPGMTVTIGVLRDGKPVDLKVKVGAYTPETVAKKPSAPESGRLGLSAEPVPEDQARELGLAGGVRIRAVRPLSDAARAGLLTGDVIVRINRQDIKDMSDYERVAGELKKGEPVVVRAWSRRSGSITTFEIDSLSE